MQMIISTKQLWYTAYVVVIGVSVAVLAMALSFVSSRDFVQTFTKNQPQTTGDTLNNRPIIGIVAQATEGFKVKYGDTYFYSSYVKYVEGGGARAAPIRVSEPDSYYEDLFSKINGVLLPGGDADPLTSPYARVVKLALQYAIKAKDSGDYFPVFGTCLGFESLILLHVGKDILITVDAEDYSIPLDFANGFTHSRLFSELTPSLHKILETENVTANAHHFAVTPQAFDEYPSLQDFYHLLSTNKDKNGVEFISAIEAHNYPIYGVQFHPEKNGYLWDPSYSWAHDYNALLVTQYFANFMVNEARHCLHKCPDLQSEYDIVIDRYTPIPLALDERPFEEIYVFNVSHTSQ